MVVGGASGGAGICWLLWTQLASRNSNSSGSLLERVLAYTLTGFLMGWSWCHRTLYVFALTQLAVVWGVIALLFLLLLALIVC
ncbi:Uncharacterized protein OBRU01_24619, partial [Operophtera brumata]